MEDMIDVDPGTMNANGRGQDSSADASAPKACQPKIPHIKWSWRRSCHFLWSGVVPELKRGISSAPAALVIHPQWLQMAQYVFWTVPTCCLSFDVFGLICAIVVRGRRQIVLLRLPAVHELSILLASSG